MKKFMSGLAIAAIASSAFVGAVSAQSTDKATSGNGGVSTSTAAVARLMSGRLTPAARLARPA